MRCSRCGRELDGKKSFCPHCGFSIPRQSSDDFFIGEQGRVLPPMKPQATYGQPLGSGLEYQVVHRETSFITDQPTRPDNQRVPITPLPPPTVFTQQTDFVSSPSRANILGADELLAPGSMLHGGSYRLLERQAYQQWGNGAYEVRWSAQDVDHGGRSVTISELMLPEKSAIVRQAHLRTAMKALTLVENHPHIPTLINVFRNHGRDFFVFEAIEGESLLTRTRRTGSPLQEQEIIECCLQITDALELFSRQTPPLLHGLISPAHIVKTATGSHWVLTNFSLLLASRATQFIADIDRTSLSPYTAPDFGRGEIDVRSDLYALMATAYHMVTGDLPSSALGDLRQAQGRSPSLSASFRAILMKGLRPVASQRYQQPSELRQDLLALRPAVGGGTEFGERSGRAAMMRQRTFQENYQGELPTSYAGDSPREFERRPQPGAMAAQPAFQERESVVARFQSAPETSVSFPFSLAPHHDLDERKVLLPLPEDLPPMSRGNDALAAAFWVAGILVCLLIPLMLLK